MSPAGNATATEQLPAAASIVQAFKITLPKIPYPNVELPRMFLGIQPPIGLPDLMPALDINWPSLPNIPGFRISLSCKPLAGQIALNAHNAIQFIKCLDCPKCSSYPCVLLAFL